MEKIYRAEVIGSLQRPTYLTEARAAMAAGKLGAAELRTVEDRAVDEALAFQARLGLDVVTDGEMRRVIFTEPLTGILDGLAPAGTMTLNWRRKEGGTQKEREMRPPFFAAVSKIKRKRWLARDEFAYAQSRTSKPLKVTLPSPTIVLPIWSPEHSRDAYADPLALLPDLVEILREEIRELAALGCKYIQFDAPELTWLADEVRLAELATIHPKLAGWMQNEGIEALNSLATVPGVTFGLHMCRGNSQGYWLSEAPWEALSKSIFRRAGNLDVFLLEYDDWRSGSFEPLRDLPPGKVAVLGLISTKHEELEPAAEIIARIEEASRFYPREQLALSPQCGFAPQPDDNVISAASQEAKLRLVADLAHRIWRSGT
ncbi:MAG TPA: cobalamin-independent methionine synthase II family protein [Candidatus Binataceae bacterium]|nr:cobalamin-independent methionine synthase II family protein [Candidatus Binataceae bacterium]